MSESQPFSPLPLLADDKCGGNCLQRRNFKKNKMSKFSKKVKQQSLAFKIYPIVKVNFHTKFHQNWTKIVEVSQSHVVGGGVGWLGWLGWSDFFYRLISQADCQDKAPYKISTRYLKAFKSYPIVKFAP